MILDEDDERRIAELIHSDDSPVGIDAKKTHVLILHKLEQIELRLERLESKLRDRDPAEVPASRQVGNSP